MTIPCWTDEIEYPLIKKVLWRFLRAGLAGAIASGNVIYGLNPDLSNAVIIGKALLAGFITGFVSGGFLYIRELISEGDKSAPIENLPL